METQVWSIFFFYVEFAFIGKRKSQSAEVWAGDGAKGTVGLWVNELKVLRYGFCAFRQKYHLWLCPPTNIRNTRLWVRPIGCPMQCLFLSVVPRAVLWESVCVSYDASLWKLGGVLSLETESFHSIQWNCHTEPGRSVFHEWPATGCFVNCKACFAKWYQQQSHVRQTFNSLISWYFLFYSRWTHWKSVEWAMAILLQGNPTFGSENGDEWD